MFVVILAAQRSTAEFRHGAPVSRAAGVSINASAKMVSTPAAGCGCRLLEATAWLTIGRALGPPSLPDAALLTRRGLSSGPTVDGDSTTSSTLNKGKITTHYAAADNATAFVRLIISETYVDTDSNACTRCRHASSKS